MELVSFYMGEKGKDSDKVFFELKPEESERGNHAVTNIWWMNNADSGNK